MQVAVIDVLYVLRCNDLVRTFVHMYVSRDGQSPTPTFLEPETASSKFVVRRVLLRRVMVSYIVRTSDLERQVLEILEGNETLGRSAKAMSPPRLSPPLI